jgi:hypothetical protein
MVAGIGQTVADRRSDIAAAPGDECTLQIMTPYCVMMAIRPSATGSRFKSIAKA